jgi:hypothetical protein
MKTSPAAHIILGIILGEIAAGIAIGAILFIAILVRMVLATSDLVSPQAFKDEREKAGDKGGEFGLDVAWPWYFRRQVLADERFVMQTRERWTKWLWSLLRAEPLKKSQWQGLFVIVSPLFWIPITIALVVMGLGNLIFLGVLYALTALVWPGYVVTIAVLRAGEAGWSGVRKTSASCPKCFYVSKRPAYKCDGCGRLHRDLRPSRLGIFERRCECREVMPTMTLRAAWSEVAVCQRCEEPLRQGAAAVRDVRMPIFGDVAAGKTRFLYAALDSMRDLGSKHAITVSFPDSDSQKRADVALSTIRTSSNTVKTDATHPSALTFRLGTGNTSSLIHMFDAAGELYLNPDEYDEVSFLDSGQGLVYVVDPFALSAIQSQVSGYVLAADHLAAAENKDPELAYSEVVTRLRGGGVKAKSQRLAVVVSKADVLFSCAIEFPTESSAIADWLMEHGLHNIVLAAPNEFAEVRYFNVASVPATATAPETDAGAPVRWLLRTQGVKLPTEAELNPAPPSEVEA